MKQLIIQCNNRLLQRLAVVVVTCALCIVMLPALALADAGRWMDSPSYIQMTEELNTLNAPDGGPAPRLTSSQQQRRSDLMILTAAIANSDDRSQVRNDSSHNLGVLTRFKKALPDAPTEFGVLSPGHETDDDYNVIALLVPSDVSLQWGDSGREAGSNSARMLQLPEGAVLDVSDTATAATAESAAYQLNLPPFALLPSLSAGIPAAALNQAGLDAQPESAPTD